MLFQVLIRVTINPAQRSSHIKYFMRYSAKLIMLCGCPQASEKVLRNIDDQVDDLSALAAARSRKLCL